MWGKRRVTHHFRLVACTITPAAIRWEEQNHVWQLAKMVYSRISWLQHVKYRTIDLHQLTRFSTRHPFSQFDALPTDQATLE